jgi:predicted membrane protein
MNGQIRRDKMHPITYTKAHPVGVLVSMAAGMIVGPWILRMINSATGVAVSLPSYGSNGG